MLSAWWAASADAAEPRLVDIHNDPAVVSPTSPVVQAAPLIITATRMPQAADTVAASVDRFTRDDLRASSSLAIDDALRASPAFSLFRRTSSLTANPTAQGVSLRGIGPSGASRSLVLLDGVPLNDPFGGWVAWASVPRLDLAGAEIVRGGGAGAWGNSALGGTVQLLTADLLAQDADLTRDRDVGRDNARGAADSSGAFSAELGDFTTQRAEFVASIPLVGAPGWDGSPSRAGDPGTQTETGAQTRTPRRGVPTLEETVLRIGGGYFSTNGFFQYAPGQRGAIDRRFDSEHTLLHADVAHAFASGLRLSAGVRQFDEERGNGTPFQRNTSRATIANVRLAGDIAPDVALDVLAYAQRESFSSGFSSVDATRTTETPALDQFDVPATALGGAIVATWRHDAKTSTTLGADVRSVRGETREDFLFSNGSFQRRRLAGGDQLVAGAFVERMQSLGEKLTAQISARVDRWSNTDGHRDEFVKATGDSVRADTFPDRDGTRPSANAGLAWKLRDDLRLRVSANRAFRVPTLNELYRPFRVGNVATEANPALAPETLTGADAGIEYARGAWHFLFGGFSSDLRDAVGNVTLASTPALTSRQRLNLDRIRVRGIEISAGAGTADGALRVAVSYLLSDARVSEAAVAPALVGRRLAEVPRHTATLQATWRPRHDWRVNVAARAVSAQFDDDENTLRLAPAVTLDLGVAWTLAPGREVSVSIENALDETVETSRTREGLVSLGPPRLARAGFSASW